MRDPNARFDVDSVELVWKKVGQLTGNPCFGIRAADHWHPSDLHALGYAWLSSRTLRSAIHRLSRYARMVTDVDEFRLEEGNGLATLVVNHPDLPDDSPWVADSTLAIILSMCRVNYGQELDPVSVTFRHSKPECASDYFEYFRCPVQFSSEYNSISITPEIIDEELPSANVMLAQVNDRIMIDYLARMDKTDVVQRTRAAIIDQLPSGKITDATVAAALYRNERTLQRQLNREGTTFKTLLNDIRMDLADKYIRDSQLSLTEISFLLGFAEISSFSRAFKRWTGNSPTRYRLSLSNPTT